MAQEYVINSGSPHDEDPLHRLKHAIEHARHLLPAQGPISVFVHHNTLHAFEDQKFDDAVRQASHIYSCNPYLPEERYHALLERGRIRPEDIAAVLLDDLGDDASTLIGFLGTRYHLRATMLQHPLQLVSDDELRWLLHESLALCRFRPSADAAAKTRMIEETRHWILRDFRAEGVPPHGPIGQLLRQFHARRIERWSDSTWEAFTLHALWQLCLAGVGGTRLSSEWLQPPIRHRDLLLEATGVDIDLWVNEVLIKFCAVYLDQGIAQWQLPAREQGFLRAFIELYKTSHPVDRWLRQLPAELRQLERWGNSPLQVIQDALDQFGVEDAETEDFITQTLLALRGWAGMLWQMESNAEWTVHPAPAGSLEEYLAVRLVLERIAAAHCLAEHFPGIALRDVRRKLLERAPRKSTQLSRDQLAFIVFQLAQTRGWKPEDISRLQPEEWQRLVSEIESFSEVERRRSYHLAYERRYRNQTLDAFAAHQQYSQPLEYVPRFQIVCCIDEREESFRRHLEEVAPDCQTFGVAGFFGMAMYYRGVADAHYKPLCPVNVKPKHYVQEEVAHSFESSHRRRTAARRALGKTSHLLHTGSRSALAGALMALLGTVASVPLVLRVLMPRLAAQIAGRFGSFIRPPQMTRLVIERSESDPGPMNGHVGYSVEEMAAIAEGVLRDLGLTERFARLVFIAGHGSSSLNNPHSSAYNCGACGGGRGGPNARALAIILNDQRIRERLAARGLVIPQQTFFVGSYHNTCDDSVDYFDLHRLPPTHQVDFEDAREAIEEARARSAHERCRRFETAQLTLSADAALRHVEARSEDLSQVRPELGHATNAVCFVGRRWRTRGLFLDRRTFLTSYDPTQDDEEGRILERILKAVIPVCGGINLEYLFSYLDPAGYGCSSKLPHNIVSLLGVMDGAASDLRPGLPWQMVEIHEPVRIMFILETAPEKVLAVLARNPNLEAIVNNGWVQLSVLDPNSARIQVIRDGKFSLYRLATSTLPIVQASIEWYRGWRDHLGYATVLPSTGGAAAATSVPSEQGAPA